VISNEGRRGPSRRPNATNLKGPEHDDHRSGCRRVSIARELRLLHAIFGVIADGDRPIGRTQSVLLRLVGSGDSRLRFHLKSAAEIAEQNWRAGWRGEEEQ
jgi:hypothetical protein